MDARFESDMEVFLAICHTNGYLREAPDNQSSDQLDLSSLCPCVRAPRCNRVASQSPLRFLWEMGQVSEKKYEQLWL